MGAQNPHVHGAIRAHVYMGEVELTLQTGATRKEHIAPRSADLCTTTSVAQLVKPGPRERGPAIESEITRLTEGNSPGILQGIPVGRDQ